MKKLTFIVLLLMLAMGCSAGGEAPGEAAGDTPKAKESVKTEKPEEAVDKALKAVKSLDEETANKYFASEWEGWVGGNAEAPVLKDDEVLKQIFGSIEYKTLSASTDGDKATVTTEITAMDLKPIFGEFLQQSMTVAMANAFAKDNPVSDEELEKQMEQIFIDLLKKEDNAKVTSTVEFALTKHENSWKIQPNEALGNAILGGLQDLAESLNGIAGEEAPKAE